MLQKQLNVLKKALYVFSIIVFIIIRSLLILIFIYKYVFHNISGIKLFEIASIEDSKITALYLL